MTNSSIALVFIASVTLVSSMIQIDRGTCPPWFIEDDTKCKCGSSLHGIVTCSDDPMNVVTKPCYCMTVNEDTNKTVVGACPFSCVVDEEWSPDPHQLNNHTCTETWKRTGRLCSKCISHYGPLVYSYSMECIPCSSHVVRDSILLFLVSLLLLTIFCLIIFTLKISGARPPMSTFILVSQVMAMPQYMFIIFTPKPYNTFTSQYVTKTQHDICWKLFATLYGLWNLDIARSFYPQMCLGSNMSTLQAQFLEYIVALFPLATLILITVSVKLYDRGYRIIFCVCKPLCSCLAHLRRTINIRTSLIDAFATFIILSINKIGYTSFIILLPVYVHSPYGNYSTSVYTQPSIEYFGWYHLPYALTALVLTIVFILIPLMLLLLYPLRSFQSFLNRCQLNFSALHIFADSFQGCYKNGMNGTRDYRWFAGLHFALRFCLAFIYDISRYWPLTFVFMIIGIVLYMMLLAVFQPYKKYIHLQLDMILFFGLLVWNVAVFAGVLGYDGDSHLNFALHLFILSLGCLIPSLYFLGLILYWLLVVKRFHLRMRKHLGRMLCYADSTRLLLSSV